MSIIFFTLGKICILYLFYLIHSFFSQEMQAFPVNILTILINIKGLLRFSSFSFFLWLYLYNTNLGIHFKKSIVVCCWNFYSISVLIYFYTSIIKNYYRLWYVLASVFVLLFFKATPVAEVPRLGAESEL